LRAGPFSLVRGVERGFLGGLGGQIARLAELLDTKQPSGCKGLLVCLPALFLEQPSADFVEIVGEHAQAHVALVTLQPFIRTAIETVVFQAIDVRFDGVMGVAQPAKAPLLFALLLSFIAAAPLGHDHFWNVEFEQLPVFLARETFVKAQAPDVANAVAADQPIRNADGLLFVIGLLIHDAIIHNQFVLIGGQQ
jgi:hypothetical protein